MKGVFEHSNNNNHTDDDDDDVGLSMLPQGMIENHQGRYQGIAEEEAPECIKHHVTFTDGWRGSWALGILTDGRRKPRRWAPPLPRGEQTASHVGGGGEKTKNI